MAKRAQVIVKLSNLYLNFLFNFFFILGKTDFVERIVKSRKKMFRNPNFDRVLFFSGLRRNCLLVEDKIFFKRFKKIFESENIPIGRALVRILKVGGPRFFFGDY